MPGRCQQGSRCHHSLATTRMDFSFTFFVFFCTWQSAFGIPFYIHYRFSSFFDVALLYKCCSPHSVSCLLLLGCSLTVAICFHHLFLAPSLCSIDLFFLLVPILTALHSRLLTISSSLSFRCKIFVPVSFLRLIHHWFFVIPSSSPFLGRTSFSTISSSLSVHHCLFVAFSL